MANKEFSASQLIDGMIGLTFTRHANLSEQEFLKEIGAEENLTESEAVRKAKFALLKGITKELLIANDKICLINATFKAIFEEKGE